LGHIILARISIERSKRSKDPLQSLFRRRKYSVTQICRRYFYPSLLNGGFSSIPGFVPQHSKIILQGRQKSTWFPESRLSRLST
jgi:hypothetical protein